MKTERIYYPVESVLCTCLYNIILNVEAVQKLEKCLNIFWVHVFFYFFIFFYIFFVCWHLLGFFFFLSASVVTLMLYCTLQLSVCSSQKRRRTSLATGWKSAGNSAILNFKLETCGKGEEGKISWLHH